MLINYFISIFVIMKKNLILKGKSEIDNLFATGVSVSSEFVFAKVLSSDSTKFLFAVSSKKFRRAVDRNRIKRLMREVTRKVDVSGIKIAFIYTGKDLPTYKEVESSINTIISKI